MTTRQHKKQKTSDSESDVKTPTVPRTCYIAKLPLELLAEILLYTKSLKDILALTRCSKFFCYTLLHETNQYIWRYARQNCLRGGLPEPCSRFTESSFAAFVFDAGPCEICGKQVNFYSSFGLRVRLCANDECSTALHSKLHINHSPKDAYKVFETTLPVGSLKETPEMSNNVGVLFLGSFAYIIRLRFNSGPNTRAVFLYSDWSRALQEYLDVSQKPDTLEEYIDASHLSYLCSRKSAQTKKYMEMCVALHTWRKQYVEAQNMMKDVNTKFSKVLAVREGLNFWDLMNTPTFSFSMKQKNASLEEIQYSDYKMWEAAIVVELVKVVESRSRRAHEAGYSTCRHAVETHYNRLRALKRETPLPSLPSFRELPTIRQIQQSVGQSEKEVDTSLQSQPIQSLVQSELAKFHLEAKNDLAAILGFRDWKSPSSKKLHPADRLTARFQCRTCHRVEAKYKDFGSLDYAGTIMHSCSVTLDKSIPQRPFKAARFEKDRKAIAAISSLLEACDISEDEKGSHELMSAIGPRVLCLSCDAQIILEPLDVIGHSHRHESMSLAILPQDEASKIIGDHALSHGLAVKLTNKGKISLEMRKLKVYMCRHCMQLKPKIMSIPTTGVAAETTSGNTASTSTAAAITKTNISINTADSAPATDTNLKAVADTAIRRVLSPAAKPRRKPAAYIFDGLRSHLKELHKIDSVRDEDFICTTELQWPKK
ncbi:hypothetical protein F5876DRAFT_74524 [Lentinula aff. lateritia]|uniref:Uncharacterized protein n=1 Tax=Lentinula aff. lateritia TaxID=2804960 RepID=A0ACC1U7I5_9AGAR|nr:hypothetical protein F5876DRAFT_74524 [Lentinula aff. lateritia]